jgi:hypothetical protein
MIKKSPPQQQNIYQHQSKQSKNGEAHGGVRQVKYADSRVHISSRQPVTVSDDNVYAPKNTKSPRTKKRSTTRRLSQLATWVEDPIVFKVQQHARKKNLSMSKTLRKLLIKVLADEEGVEEALDTEALREAIARDNRRLAKRLIRFLLWLVYDVGQIKVLANNTIGMQKGMTEAMLKDILQDADRQTKKRLSRQNPELAGFMDEVEKWLFADEDEGRGRGA